MSEPTTATRTCVEPGCDELVKGSRGPASRCKPHRDEWRARAREQHIEVLGEGAGPEYGSGRSPLLVDERTDKSRPVRLVTAPNGSVAVELGEPEVEPEGEEARLRREVGRLQFLLGERQHLRFTPTEGDGPAVRAVLALIPAALEEDAQMRRLAEELAKVKQLRSILDGQIMRLWQDRKAPARRS